MVKFEGHWASITPKIQRAHSEDSEGRMRGSVVLPRGYQILEVRRYAIMAHTGDFSAMEWLGKATLAYLTNHLEGRRVLVADSAAATFGGQKLPQYGTWMTEFMRSSLAGADLSAYLEGLVQAQYDSQVQSFPAMCNKVADEEATAALEEACSFDLFVPQDAAWGPVFHKEGRIILDLSSSLDNVYGEAMRRRAQTGITGWDTRWVTQQQVKALTLGRLGNESVKRTMLLRQGTHEERHQSSGTCIWCR